MFLYSTTYKDKEDAFKKPILETRGNLGKRQMEKVSMLMNRKRSNRISTFLDSHKAMPDENFAGLRMGNFGVGDNDRD